MSPFFDIKEPGITGLLVLDIVRTFDTNANSVLLVTCYFVLTHFYHKSFIFFFLKASMFKGVLIQTSEN